MGQNTNVKAILCGDIGGTHTRLGIFVGGKSRPRLTDYQEYQNEQENSLEDILEKFIRRIDSEVPAAWLAIAGPIENGETRTTNLPWKISEAAIKRRFKFTHVRLINDLSAMVFAVPWLTEKELTIINPGEPEDNGNVAVIAPGTGLGMALLIRHGRDYRSMASEGGHTDFAPSNEDEWELWKFLNKRFGHVSNERLLSGPGLVNIYHWIVQNKKHASADLTESKKKNQDLPEIITRSALDQTDPACEAALDMFVSILGAVAGNLALMGLTRGGIYLGGGIPPKILPKLYKNSGPFFKAFIRKGRFEEWVHKTPVNVITHDNPALLGIASMAFYDQPDSECERTA